MAATLFVRPSPNALLQQIPLQHLEIHDDDDHENNHNCNHDKNVKILKKKGRQKIPTFQQWMTRVAKNYQKATTNK